MNVSPDASLKQCKKCQQFLPATPDFFYKHKLTKDGFDSACKSCRGACNKSYREVHKEQTAERAKRYAEAHKESLREYHQQYYENHKEQAIEKSRQRYETHRDEIRQQTKQYRETHREHILESKKQYRNIHRERLVAQQRQHYHAHREQMLQRHRRDYETYRERRLEAMKRYRETHREQVLERKKRYYEAHRDEDNARRRAYHLAHLEQERKHAKEFRDAHPELIRERKKIYRETYKEQVAERKKLWQQGESYKTYQKQYHQEHLEEAHRQGRQNYLTNREQRLEKQKAYLRTLRGRMVGRAHRHKRKALKRASKGSYTPQQLQEQYQRQKSKCYYCKAKLGKAWHADHVVPLSRGGSNDIHNIVIACPTCNMHKSARLPHEWPEGNRLL